jgi:methyl-accepting chemotaxis protein
MADITYKQLRREVQAFAKKVRKNADQLTEQAKQTERAANRTAKVGDMIAGMQVSTATIGEMSELAQIMQAAAKGAAEFISASDTTARAADDADQQAQVSHEGINEAVGRSPEHAGKSGWYRQE